ncbi:hypothetical protein AgCh_000960 [Apium graveolens]
MWAWDQQRSRDSDQTMTFSIDTPHTQLYEEGVEESSEVEQAGTTKEYNWRHAMESEMKSIEQNNTLKLTELSSDRKAVDFDELFAPVTRMEIVQLWLALATNHNWEVYHLDVKKAFMNGTNAVVIDQFKKHMGDKFEMNDLGKLSYYLGIEVHQGRGYIELK